MGYDGILVGAATIVCRPRRSTPRPTVNCLLDIFELVTGPGNLGPLGPTANPLEQHVDWIADCRSDMRDGRHSIIEAEPAAE
jgi:hypothetical protein